MTSLTPTFFLLLMVFPGPQLPQVPDMKQESADLLTQSILAGKRVDEIFTARNLNNYDIGSDLQWYLFTLAKLSTVKEIADREGDILYFSLSKDMVTRCFKVLELARSRDILDKEMIAYARQIIATETQPKSYPFWQDITFRRLFTERFKLGPDTVRLNMTNFVLQKMTPWVCSAALVDLLNEKADQMAALGETNNNPSMIEYSIALLQHLPGKSDKSADDRISQYMERMRKVIEAAKKEEEDRVARETAQAKQLSQLNDRLNDSKQQQATPASNSTPDSHRRITGEVPNVQPEGNQALGQTMPKNGEFGMSGGFGNVLWWMLGIYILFAGTVALRIVRPPMIGWYRSSWFFIFGKNPVDIFLRQIGFRIGFELFIFGVSCLVGALGLWIIALKKRHNGRIPDGLPPPKGGIIR